MRSTSTNWSGPWTKSRFCRGKGLVIEGAVRQIRVHSVFVSGAKVNVQALEDNLPTRFVVVTLQPKVMHHRLFRTQSGMEMEIDYFDNVPGTKEYVAPDKLDFNQLQRLVGSAAGALPDGVLDAQRAQLHPKANGLFEFWIDSERPKAKEICEGHEVRVLTIGDSIFVESFQLLNAKLNVFKGMGDDGAQLSTEYATNIMHYAEPESGREEKSDRGDACDEEEWSD